MSPPLVLSGIVQVILVLILVLSLAGCGSSHPTKYWTDLAAEANRACYHDHGVRQITFFDSAFEFVCIDGWVVHD